MQLAALMTEMQLLRDAALSGLARDRLAILDVGAGRTSSFRVDGAQLVGFDSSSEELALNPHLDERVVGRIEEGSLPAGPFDVAVLWDVLEHVDAPHEALSKVSEVLAPDSAIVIAAPDPLSLKGVTTKITPLAFHRHVLRRVLPFVEREPFPTYLRFEMRPSAIRTWATRNGFDVVFFSLEEGLIQRRLRARLRLHGWRWRLVRLLFRAVTLGRGSAAHTDYRMVLRRRPVVSPDSARNLL